MTTEELIAARRAEPWREALRKSKKNKERADFLAVSLLLLQWQALLFLDRRRLPFIKKAVK